MQTKCLNNVLKILNTYLNNDFVKGGKLACDHGALRKRWVYQRDPGTAILVDKIYKHQKGAFVLLRNTKITAFCSGYLVSRT